MPPKPCAMWPLVITAGVNDTIAVAPAALYDVYTATVAPGTYYSPADLAAAVQSALGSAWANTWAVSFGATGRITLSGAGAFALVSVLGDANLLTYSEQMDNAAWTKARMTVTADAVAAPDGSLSAEKITETGDASPYLHIVNMPLSVTAGVSYTFSVYAKAAERGHLKINCGGVGVGVVTLATRAVQVSAGTIAVTDAGGGWCRIAVTFVPLSTASYSMQMILHNGTTDTYTGDGASGLYVWGAQAREGITAGVYSATTSAPAAGGTSAPVTLRRLLGIEDGTLGPGASISGAGQHASAWYGSDPAADDSYDRPSRIIRSQTRSLSGKVRTRTFATTYERAIGLAYLPPHKTFISEEGSSYTNEALERLFLNGAERLRWWPDASVPGTYADYALSKDVAFDPKRLAPAVDLYAQPLRLLRYIT
jgi:hypothetical protein